MSFITANPIEGSGLERARRLNYPPPSVRRVSHGGPSCPVSKLVPWLPLTYLLYGPRKAGRRQHCEWGTCASWYQLCWRFQRADTCPLGAWLQKPSAAALKSRQEEMSQ
ncbi:hypothetical protein AAFF_G00332360 [Aldrovandia affinis]|uniref:Uncharacterized protein n=1 Tax=Aldrovandia affinis TaxID=143900 RepID=A0AAD7WQQ2_9TELE|nr:hypothetical protein AAFF_G00332360 [Aldrovandia affinis]